MRGEGFDPSSVVAIAGTDVPTTFDSPLSVHAEVPNRLLRTAGSREVVVRRAIGSTSPLVLTVKKKSSSGGGTSGGQVDCGSSQRCSDIGVKVGECFGDFPAYRCEADGCVHLVGGC